MDILKRLTATLIAFVISAGTIGVIAAENEKSENLLINGNCEEDFLGTTGWRFRDKGGWYLESEFDRGLVSDNIVEGKCALYFHSATVAQRVALERNKTYVISFFARSEEEKQINFDFCDGAQDWPASYSVMHENVPVNKEWQKHTFEFECENTQDYLVSFNLWDEVNVYLDDIRLVEKDAYVSRLVTGVNGEGEISYSADTVGEGNFTAALYDSENNLLAVKDKTKKGTFPKVTDYGDYTVKCYLSGDELASKTQRVTYNAESGLNSDNSLGAASTLTLSEHNLTLTMSSMDAKLDAVLTPKFAYNNKVLWESDNETVASVSENGIITPVGEGSATITARLTDGTLSDSCQVTVTANNNHKVTLDRTSISLKEVDSLYPLHATGENITWKSENEKVAVVNDGVVTAVGKGRTNITATDGKTSAKCAVSVTESDNTITNDTFRKDTKGNTIYAQGGCIQKFGDKYYWYGIKYKEGPIYAKNPEKGKAGNAQYDCFVCYTSTDLVNWKYEGVACNEKSDGWVGRMGVAYNENTKKYVLISQFAPGMIFATADKPTGPFKKDHIFTDTLPIEKGGTGDQTVFQDDDGKAYLICASWEGREWMYVIPLRESDFLDFDYDNIKLVHHDEDGSYIDEKGEVQFRDKKGIEGNCMFKYNGNYYFTGSDLYGWYSSRVYYFKSDSILGDYNSDARLPIIMNGARDGYAHNSQAGFYVTIHGSEQDLVMYCGDRWGGFAGNGKGYNQWVPITMNEDGTPYFNDLHQWKLNAEKGTWEVGEGNNYIRNNEFEDDRHITNNPNGWVTRDNVGGYANSSERARVDAGNFVWQQKAPEDYIADIQQTITDLPDGTYIMTAFVKSSGGQNMASLYAVTSEGAYTKSVKTVIDEWTEVVVADNIEVKDGKCAVGLYSDAHKDEWVQMDNLRLVKVN